MHPVLGPSEISARLALSADHQHAAGAKRHTPTGDPLPGRYPDTRWRHVEYHDSPQGQFADKLANFIRMIEQRRKAIDHLLRSGGSATAIVAFLGDGAYGDELTPDLLGRLAACGVNLGIEVYSTPQN